MAARLFRNDQEPADYCPLGAAPEHRLSQFERLTLTGGRDLEKALAFIARQIAGFSFHDFTLPALQEIPARSAWYREGEFRRSPAYFFTPPGRPSVRETLVHGLRDGAILDLSFPSEYRSRHPQTLPMVPENEVVHARLWQHRDPAPATVVALHGWTMGDQRLNSLAFLPGIFYRLGLDVVLVELPFHGRRRPAVSSAEGLNGFVFPSPDIVRTNEALGQAISDLRALRLHLEARGAREVGWMGMSLGAYVGALWSGLDESAFAVPIVPLVSMAEVAWDMITRSPAFTEAPPDFDVELLRDAFAVHCPLSYPARLPRERALLIAGIGDQIVPSRQPKLLWDHWRRPRIQWLSGGHEALFQRSRAFIQVVRFFEDLGYLAPGSFDTNR